MGFETAGLFGEVSKGVRLDAAFRCGKRGGIFAGCIQIETARNSGNERCMSDDGGGVSGYT